MPDTLAEKVVKVFMIILHNRMHCRFGFITLCLIAIAACTPNDYDDPIPYAPFPEIVLNLNLPQYIALKSTGATLEIGGGVRGIIIYCKQPGNYAAYERNCSYHPNDACATVNVDLSKLFLLDPCCGSTFDITTGMPTGGVAVRPLAQYRTTFDGVLLTIFDERIE
jgi:nitrite reductase/ring-hydroxylating ferredoxin subunit